jgi:hypothetical protein
MYIFEMNYLNKNLVFHRSIDILDYTQIKNKYYEKNYFIIHFGFDSQFWVCSEPHFKWNF